MKTETYNRNNFINSPVTKGNGNTIINGMNQGIDELDNIIKEIIKDSQGLNEEQAENIKDIAEMAREELAKPKPKSSRLRNCLTLIAPMFTVANGIPTLTRNLQNLVDYIRAYIGN